MYNKYMSQDMDAFSELYRPIEYEEDVTEKKNAHKEKTNFSLGKLLRGLDVESIGILPLVLLLLLLLDVDDEEKLIIIVLAVLLGI